MKALKLTTAYLITLLINLLFTLKYFTRYTESGIYLALMVLVIQAIGIFYFERKSISEKTLRFLAYFFMVFLLILTVGTHVYIHLESLNVDRWSVIASFINELLKGDYPYLAQSHMGNYPGPFPFYFVIALPFHLIGELSLLSVLGYILLVFLFVRKKNDHLRLGSVWLFLLATSFYVYWEIMTRSNIFTYTVLILLVLLFFTILNKNKPDKMFLLSAILSGLLLSTRAIFALAYVVVFLSTLIKKEIKIKSLLIFTLISLAIFISTFLPFFVFFNDDFLKVNPFIVQSSVMLPGGYVFIFFLISVLLAFLVKSDLDKFFYSGLSLFFAILIYFLYQWITIGLDKTWFGSGADISYFLFCIPFFFYYTVNYRSVSI